MPARTGVLHVHDLLPGDGTPAPSGFSRCSFSLHPGMLPTPYGTMSRATPT